MKKYGLKTLYSSPMPNVEVALFHSANKLIKRFAERGLTLDLDNTEAAATFPVSLNDGSRVYIVYINMEKAGKLDTWAQMELLVHEAVHVAARYFESIGETHPGEEEFAYVCEAASGLLFDMHEKYLRKTKKAGVKDDK